MALEGNAKDFGLSEIFQLISIQKKSGMLSISAEESMAVFFRDGMVISTRDRRNRSKDPLKDYLLRYGFLDREEMAGLQKIQSDTNLDLTDILLSEKYFSEDELRTIFVDQIYESFQEILSWPKSYYKFIIGTQVLSGIRSYASLKVEGLLMESMRRIDEFPEMLRIFPHQEMILKRLPYSEDRGECLERSEEIVYGMLEIERSLSYLISHSRMTRFTTYEALKQLLEKGLLEIIEDAAPQDEKVEQEPVEKKKKRKKKLTPTFSLVALLLGSFAVGEYVVPRVMPPGWTADMLTGTSVFASPDRGGLAADIGTIRARQAETTIREALEEYRAAKGSYPFSLEVLAVEGIVDRHVIEASQRLGIIYRTGEGGSSYTIERR